MALTQTSDVVAERDKLVTQRVALVTGGGRGIGEAIANRLVRQGRHVAVTDVVVERADEVAATINQAQGKAMSVQLDVVDPDSVQAGVDRVTREMGPIDVLVNNAGWDEAMPFLDTTEELWRKILEINYLGALRTTHCVLPGMLDRGWGRIVNIGSDAARVGSSHEAVYAGAKAGVIAFTKTVAREAARKGVTANVVCPGPTLTPLVQGNIAEDPDAADLLDRLKRAIPMRRLAQPEDIAAGVAFFASEEAGYVTGQTLSVSGGLTMA